MSFGRVRQRPVQSMHLELPVRKRKKSRRSTGDDPVFGSLAMAIGYTQL